MFTARKFIEKKLLLASNNPGKIREITDLLTPHDIKIISVTDLNIEEPEETGLTFIDNAKLKAEYYGQLQNIPALSDDSGLSIEALDGFPGIFSARFAGPNKSFVDAFKLIEQKLLDKNLTTSPAFFTCALALWWPDGHFEIFEEKLHGNLTFHASHEPGFGYNPIFIPNGYDKTMAQISHEEKNQMSHRAKAFNKMVQACFN